METELRTLYNTVSVYRHSITENMCKIDENVLQAVNNFQHTNSQLSITRKYKTSLIIVEILQKYVTILDTCENVSHNLARKLADLEDDPDPQPEREISNTNPFFSIDFHESASDPLDYSNFLQPKAEESCSSSLSDTSELNTTLILGSCLESEESERKEESEIGKSNAQGPSHTGSAQETSLTKEKDKSNTRRTSETKEKASSSVQETKEKDKSSTRRTSETKEKANSSVQEISHTEEKDKSSTQKSSHTKEKILAVAMEESSPKTEKKSPKQKNKIPQISAAEKLQRMPRYDRRQEAVKLIENKKVPQSLPYETVPASQLQSPKKEKRKLKTYTVSDNKVNEGQTCVLCHIESPSEFYVRTDQSLFESFEARFNEDMNSRQYVVNGFKTKAEAKENFGNFCFGFLGLRNKWYRVEVLNWMDVEPDSILVQLIDYGEKLYMSYQNLKAMDDFYALFFKMAVRCHLAGIYSPKTSWPKASVDFFAEVSEGVEFVAVYVHKEGDSYAVDLRDAINPDADTLGEFLVRNNHAFEVKLSPVQEDEYEDEEFETVTEAITGYDATDEARICPFSNSTGSCFKGPSCHLEHGRLSEDGITSDKVLTVNQALTTLELPKVGEDVEILITGYINTCCFYARVLNKTRNDEFQRLTETMNESKVIPTYQKFKLYPGISEMVLVKVLATWYRGRCIGYTNNEAFEIFMVDIGQKVITTLKDLRIMNEDFLHVPFQAVECVLSNCQEKKAVSASLSRSFFDDVMKSKTFKGVVVDTDGRLWLQLWDSQGMDMSYVLKQYGIGEDRDEAAYPTANGISCG